MADEEKQDPEEMMYELMSPEHRNFKMIERLTEQVDKINKETQAKMEFIVDRQAQFAANIQIHNEGLSNLQNIVTRLANITLSGQEEFNTKVSTIIDAQIKTEEALQKLAESQAKLADSQAHTDKRLDALIDIVREDREGRNGKS